MSEHPSESVPQATSNISQSQSIYRFWSNKQIKTEQILASHRSSVVQRANQAKVVLAIQDTTDLDFTGLKKTTGMGFINQTQQQGLKVHSCIAVSGKGEPLGLLHQQSWSREQRTGKRGERRKKVTGEKESQRWLDTLGAAESGIDKSVCLIHVGDREADIFDLFAKPRRENSELLLRGTHNRKLEREMGYLLPTIAQAPILGKKTIDIARNPKRPARQATLTVRGMEVTLAVPRHHLSSSQSQPVTLNVLLVEESNPPPAEQPIHWLLLTTLAIDTFERAWQCVSWYSLRWLIERFHFTLKSGCRLEQLQLETAQRLLKALATYSIIAWRLMHLTYLSRLSPEDSCMSVVETSEWKLLRRKFEPQNRSRKPPTIRQVMVWIAQLGGFLARKGDGEPGLKTLWRGIGVLHHLLEGVRLATKT